MQQQTAPPARKYPPARAPEPAWPAQATILVAALLQLTQPDRLTIGPNWLIPSLEGVLGIGLILSTPRQLEHNHEGRRKFALGLVALVSAANVFSLLELSHFLLRHSTPNARELIGAGALIWLTNVLIFALWYWELDRGGPGIRAEALDGPPDFLFPQMSDDTIEPREWRPHYIDYMYVSLTNAMAFSPTDTMPLSAMAKSIMGLQSLVSLVTIGLIVSRAVNIL